MSISLIYIEALVVMICNIFTKVENLHDLVQIKVVFLSSLGNILPL